MIRFQSLFNEAGGAEGGGGTTAGGAGSAQNPPIEGGGNAPPPPVAGGADPWSEYLTKHPEPTKLEPYKAAKSAVEAFELSQARLAEAQTALRSRPASVITARPAADAPPEVHSAWRQANGIPETPEGYGLTKPEGLPDELWNAGEAAEFAKFAHEKGMSPELVKDLQAWYAQSTQGQVSAIQQQSAQQAEALRLSEAAELGKRFGDKLDPVLKDLQSVAQAMGRDTGIFDPASDKFWGVEAVSLYADMLKRIPRGEDGTVRAIGTPAANSAYDKQWAKASLQKGHPDYEARTNVNHPRHKEIMRLANEAYALG